MASTSSLTRKGLIKRDDTLASLILSVIRAVGSAVIITTGVLPRNRDINRRFAASSSTTKIVCDIFLHSEEQLVCHEVSPARRYYVWAVKPSRNVRLSKTMKRHCHSRVEASNYRPL